MTLAEIEDTFFFCVMSSTKQIFLDKLQRIRVKLYIRVKLCHSSEAQRFG